MFAALFFHGFKAAEFQQGFATSVFRRHAGRDVERRRLLQMQAEFFREVFFPLTGRILSPPETHVSCSFAAVRPRVQARSRIRATADESRSHSANSFSSCWRPVFVSE